jgi:hypothetical protein
VEHRDGCVLVGVELIERRAERLCGWPVNSVSAIRPRQQDGRDRPVALDAYWLAY